MGAQKGSKTGAFKQTMAIVKLQRLTRRLLKIATGSPGLCLASSVAFQALLELDDHATTPEGRLADVLELLAVLPPRDRRRSALHLGNS
jgi:hypothetical protein